MSSRSVVLPAPFLPSTPTTSPGEMPNERSCSTSFGPKDLLRCVASAVVALFIGFLPLATQGFRELRLAQFKLPRGQHHLVDERIDLLQPFRKLRMVPGLARDRHRLA